MKKRTFQNCIFYRSGDVFFADTEVFKGQGNDTKVLRLIWMISILSNQLKKWRNKKWEKCIMKTQKKMQHLNDVAMLSLTWLKIWSTVKKKWAVEEWLRNIHVGCFWKELAVKRYGRYVENMKKWKFGLEKSTAWQYQIDLPMNPIYNKVKMIMT